MIIYSNEIGNFPADMPISFPTKEDNTWKIRIFKNKSCTKMESQTFGSFKTLIDLISHCAENEIDLVLPNPELFIGLDKEKVKAKIAQLDIEHLNVDLFVKAEKLGNNRKLLRNRLQEGKSVLKDEYKADFKNCEYDFENKRLIGKKYVLQWINRGTNSEGQVGLYLKKLQK